MAAGAAAAAAAAEQRRRQQEEEERMTTYSPDDINQDWEFKIVRANVNAFRFPEKLQQVINEEARAGWIMVEKFDDQRVRFKRPRSARVNDANLPAGVNPYRTHFGMSPGMYSLVVVGVTLVVTFGCIGAGFFLIFLGGGL